MALFTQTSNATGTSSGLRQSNVDQSSAVLPSAGSLAIACGAISVASLIVAQALNFDISVLNDNPTYLTHEQFAERWDDRFWTTGLPFTAFVVSGVAAAASGLKFTFNVMSRMTYPLLKTTAALGLITAGLIFGGMELVNQAVYDVDGAAENSWLNTVGEAMKNIGEYTLLATIASGIILTSKSLADGFNFLSRMDPFGSRGLGLLAGALTAGLLTAATLASLTSDFEKHPLLSKENTGQVFSSPAPPVPKR